jgi:hypothetical protein
MKSSEPDIRLQAIRKSGTGSVYSLGFDRPFCQAPEYPQRHGGNKSLQARDITASHKGAIARGPGVDEVQNANIDIGIKEGRPAGRSIHSYLTVI